MVFIGALRMQRAHLPFIGAPLRGTKISPGGVKLNFFE
jgi:hypothetical protein